MATVNRLLLLSELCMEKFICTVLCLNTTTEQAAAYQTKINKLEEAGYVVKLEPHLVEETEEAWYIPHHLVLQLVYN